MKGKRAPLLFFAGKRAAVQKYCQMTDKGENSISWDLPDPPDWLLQKAAAEYYTTNPADWRCHGPAAEPQEEVICTHRGLSEASPVRLKRIAGPAGDFYSLGQCEICGMVHWLSSGK